MTVLRYSTVLFDWGDTVMIDSDPASPVPMAQWPTLEIVPGIEAVLQLLRASGRKIILATGAAVSTPDQIWAALARVGLENYFDRIFCFKNTGLPKSADFYAHILKALPIQSSEALMIGDSFEKDVFAPDSLGIQAVWFNPSAPKTGAGLCIPPSTACRN